MADGFYAEEFHIKQGDLLPVFEGTCEDGAGRPVDLSGGGTLRFKMRPAAGGTLKVNAVATILDTGDEEDGTRGTFRYSWAGTDTDTAGDFDAEVEFTSGGKPLTFPNDGYQRIVITDDL